MSRQNYRLKITDANNNICFLSRSGERVSYLSQSGTPLSLAYIKYDSAAEILFAADDAEDGMAALAAIRPFLGRGAVAEVYHTAISDRPNAHDLVQRIAGMRVYGTEGEIDGDDALETMNSLIRSARELTGISGPVEG